MRIGDNRIRKKPLNPEPKKRKCSSNKPTNKYKDNLKDKLKALRMDALHWQELNLNRTEWRYFISGWIQCF